MLSRWRRFTGLFAGLALALLLTSAPAAAQKGGGRGAAPVATAPGGPVDHTTWGGSYQYATMNESEPLTIEFFGNGRARAQHVGQTQDWTYTVSGNRIILLSSSGSTWTATISGGTLLGTMTYPGHGDGVFSLQHRAWANGVADLSQLHRNVRSAAETARAEQARAHAAAQRARQGDGVVSMGSDGDTYEGEDGAIGDITRAVQTFPSGDTYAGAYVRGTPDAFSGNGVYRFANGQTYEGEWANSQYNGFGVLWDAQGRVMQAGIWRNNQLERALSR